MATKSASILVDVACRACRHWFKARYAVGTVADHQAGDSCPRCYSTATEVVLPYSHVTATPSTGA
jgi:hypothetical protein